MKTLPPRPWFTAGPTPPRVSSVRVEHDTTPRRLTLRTISAVPRYLAPAAVLTSLHQVGEALVPVVVGRAIDEAVGPGNPVALLTWLLVLAAVFCFLSFSFRFGARIGFLGMNSVQHDIRMLVTDKLLAPGGVGGAGRRIGNYLSVATSDTTMLATGIGLAVYGPATIVAVVVCAVVLLAISWPLGIGVLVGAGLVLVLGDLLGGVLRARVKTQQSAIADAAGTAADLVQGLRIIKGLGAQRIVAERYAAVSGQALDASVSAAKAQARSFGVLQALTGLFVVAVGAAAGWMTLRGAITVGELITVVMLSQFVMEPISAIPRMVNFFWNPAVAAAGRILEVLNSHPAVIESPDARDLPTAPTRRGLRIRGLPSTTPDSTAPDSKALDSTELDSTEPETAPELLIAPGEHLALECSGRMRTEMVNLLGRLADTESRAWLLDDQAGTPSAIALETLTLTSARHAVMVAPHEPHLFVGSVLDNVTLGGEEFGSDDTAAPESERGQRNAQECDAQECDAQEALDKVLRASACDQVAEMLPEGLDTDVGEYGGRLSGGQRQRVGLARVLWADPDILVLLDPTSAVDSVTEHLIARETLALRQGRTTVVLTDSPAWHQLTDRSLVLGHEEPDEAADLLGEQDELDHQDELEEQAVR